MNDILKDSRFTKYLNDPRYKQIPKHERKVKIDKRFDSMFTGERFKVKYTVDKRGRPVNETSAENLRKYYDLEESEEDSNSEQNIEEEENHEDSDRIVDESSSGRFVKRPPSDKEDNEDVKPKFKNDKLIRGKLDDKTKTRLLDLDIDYARGEGVLLSESSSDDESSDEEEDSDVEHEWGKLDADAETTDEATKRIAICNMDWDNIKASDIMVLLSSFLPPGGVIFSVSIYPSEYGLKRMQEEEIRGPIELTEQKEEDGDLSNDSGNEEGSTFHMEKLRRYQLNRLKYYYAVVECESAATADRLYADCDGMEYESSATHLDMRFVPDDVVFDQKPREVCTKLPDLSKYKPRLFTTTALQQAKVELTWDATNPNRTEAIKSALDGKIDDLDLKEYLASSSDEDEHEKEDNLSENENEDSIKKYKMLLEDIDKQDDKKNDKEMEMEITWGLGVKEKAEELVKKKMEDSEKLTPFEKYLKKRKEKKKEKKSQKNAKEKHGDSSNSDGYSSDDVPSDIDMNDPYFAEEFEKAEFKKTKSKKSKKDSATDNNALEDEEKRNAELELLVDDEDDGKAHFSLKKIQEAENITKTNRKKKLKKKKAMEQQKQSLPDFEVDINDQRFSTLYDSHHFNIDPTDPNYKKTKTMERVIQEKLKRRPADVPPASEVPPKRSKNAELNVLVKNIKRKTKHIYLGIKYNARTETKDRFSNSKKKSNEILYEPGPKSIDYIN